MFKPTIAALLLALAATAAEAQPRAVVTGPKESRCGSLVVLDASESTGTGRLWLLAVAPEDTSFLPVESGRQCIFASPIPGSYRFVLIVSGNNANGGAAADMATHTVILRGATPPPPPPIDPDDPIQPPPDVVTTGETHVIIIRHNGELTAEQAVILSKLRTWTDSQAATVTHLEFSPDDGAADERVRAYVSKIPAGSPLPWVFVSRLRSDGKGATVLWSGPLPAKAETLIATVQEKAK